MAYKPDGPPPEFDYDNWQATEEMVRSPENNRRRTRALFKESMNLVQLKKYPPTYTLSETATWEAYHGLWLPSAKQIYLKAVDEYEAAQRLVVSVEHWAYLLNLNWFMTGMEDTPTWTSLIQWRQEHRQIRESEALRLLWKEAREGNVTAIKAMLAHEKVHGRGRPSKEEVTGHLKKQAAVKTDFDKDHERILSLVRDNGK